MTTDNAYRSIRKRLVAIRNRIAGVETSLTVVQILGGLLLFLLVNVLLGYAASSWAVLRVAAILSLGAFLVFAGFRAVRLVRRWPRLDWIAAEAERATPELKGDILRSALDLGKRKDDPRFGYSPSLIEALLLDAFGKSEAIRERAVVGAAKLRRALPALPFAALAVFFLFFLVPERTARIALALGPADGARVLEEVGLEVFPGDCAIEAGERVPVEARFTDYPGGDAHLVLKTGEAESKVFPMAELRRGDTRRFEAEIPPLEKDASYLVRFAGGESRSYRIDVHHPPVMTNIAYTLRFPGYTGLEDRPVRENHGNVTALYGTEVVLEGTANKPVAEARLEREDLEPIRLEADGRELAGAFTVEERFSYKVRLVDAEGGTNLDPVRYEVTPVPDEKPFIRVIYPGENIDLDREMKVDLQFSALDDYGVTAVNLVYRIGEGDETKVPLFTTKHRLTEVERGRGWDLSDARILPDEVISYYVEAWDNDSLRGPKRGVSRTYQIRMPSLAEIFAEVSGDQETEIAELEEIYEETRDLEERLDEISREIQKNEEISWDEKKKIEGILDKQKEIEQSLREVSNEMEKAADQLEENRLVTPETIERMMELTRLLNEVATDEMKQALMNLQTAMRDLKPEEIRQAAENLELSQQDFLERLDRSIEMLKRMKDVQDADALAENLQRLAEEQRKLRERGESGEEGDTDRLAAEEQALQRELDRMAEQMEELAEQSAETSPSISENVHQALEELKERKTSQKMEKAANDLKGGNQQKASKSQKDAENDLFDLSFRLAEFVEAFCSAAANNTSAAFGESIQDLLYLSKRQEEIIENSGGNRRNVALDRRRDLAERQLDVSIGIGRVMEKVRDVGKESPQLSSMVLDLLRRGKRKADAAAENMETGEMDLARARSAESMLHLNRSVVELLRSQQNHSSSCSNPKGKSQGLGQMQQMTNQQRSLNQESSQIPLPSSNPASIPMETRSQMARLAAEQNTIRKGLESLQQEVEEDGDVLGRLDEIMEEMRQVERDLENSELSQSTRERQERILSRMLDAQRSIRDRGYRKDRRSRTGGPVETAAPGAVPRNLNEARERMREDRVRTESFAYPPEYEELIRSYFRVLSEKE